MSEEIVKTFAMQPGYQLEVANIRGSTHIEGWDRPEAEIRAQKRGGGDGAEMTEIEIGQEGNKVYARTRVKRTEWLGWLGMKQPAPVDYVIKVPYQCHVATDMVSGKTEVQGVHGGLKLSTVSGDAEVADLAGDCQLKTVSGDIRARQVEGRLKVNTVSGDVRVKTSQLASLQANTVSGDLTMSTPLQPDGEYSAHSVSGDFKLEVPAETRCTVAMSTVSGDLRCALPHDVLENRRGSKRYAVNGGGVTVMFSSVSGDMSVRTGEGEPAAAREPVSAAEDWSAAAEDVAHTETRSAEGDPSTERMRILKAIENGEMTVEEGIARLQALAGE